MRPRRSAFAAAFLSFIFPGLGPCLPGPLAARAAVGGPAHRRHRRHRAAWAVSYSRDDLIELVADPDCPQRHARLPRLRLLLPPHRGARRLPPGRGHAASGDASTRIALDRPACSPSWSCSWAATSPSRARSSSPPTCTRPSSSNAGDESEVLTRGGAGPARGRGVRAHHRGADPAGDARRRSAPDDPERGRPSPPRSPRPSPPTRPRRTRPRSPRPRARTAEWDGKERLNILLIGQDGGRQGVNDGSLLTDTMITISVDPTTGRLAFISLPRDATRHPAAQAAGRPIEPSAASGTTRSTRSTPRPAPAPTSSPATTSSAATTALMGALGELYGLDIKYYVAVDLNSFRAVVNTLGGVVVDVQLPVMDTATPPATAAASSSSTCRRVCASMNGQEALAYARSRHGSSDFDRSARQQRVITSVRDQTDIDSLLEPGVITELIKKLQKDVKTNIPPKLVPTMLTLAQDVDLDRRENLVLCERQYVEDLLPLRQLRAVDAQGQAGHHQGRRQERLQHQQGQAALDQQDPRRRRRGLRAQRPGRPQHQGHQHRLQPRRQGHRTRSCRRSTTARPKATTSRTPSSPSTTAPTRPCRRRSRRSSAPSRTRSARSSSSTTPSARRTSSSWSASKTEALKP